MVYGANTVMISCDLDQEDLQEEEITYNHTGTSYDRIQEPFDNKDMVSIIERELSRKTDFNTVPRSLAHLRQQMDMLPDFNYITKENEDSLPEFVFVEGNGANVYEVKHEETKDETQEEKGKPIPKQNAIFEMYYKGIGILPDEEWSAFYAKLKEPLDICFRINSIE
jgi:hypothetical protein